MPSSPSLRRSPTSSKRTLLLTAKTNVKSLPFSARDPPEIILSKHWSPLKTTVSSKKTRKARPCLPFVGLILLASLFTYLVTLSTTIVTKGVENKIPELHGSSDTTRKVRELLPSSSTSSQLLKQRPLTSNGNTSECLLLFGAYKNGNLGDVGQPRSIINILRTAYGPDLCIKTSSKYYKPKPQTGEGELLVSNSVVHAGDLQCDDNMTSAGIVNEHGSLLIAGGGLLTSRHTPLDCKSFERGLRPDLPIAFLGVGAEDQTSVELAQPLMDRSIFVSVRDTRSKNVTTAAITAPATATATRDTIVGNSTTSDHFIPDDVLIARDPILSDSTLTDTHGTKCWGKWKNDNPVCVVLPGLKTRYTDGSLPGIHKAIAGWFEPNKTRLFNVFPKHYDGIKKYYQNFGPITNIMDPTTFQDEICKSCRLVFSFRLHGAVFGLHGGLPTIIAAETTVGKHNSLMTDVLDLVDQFFLASKKTKASTVAHQIERVVTEYEENDRRTVIFDKMDGFSNDIHQLLLKYQDRLIPWHTSNLKEQ